MRLLFDIEANGFLDTVDTLWCLVAYDLDSGVTRRYSPFDWDEAVEYLSDADVLVGHNIIDYDLPAIWKVHGPWATCPKVIDTLVISRFLQPERQGHSLEAWGKRLGFPKGAHTDFSMYTKEMLEYCEQDVRVNVKVLEALEKENGAAFGGYKIY